MTKYELVYKSYDHKLSCINPESCQTKPKIVFFPKLIHAFNKKKERRLSQLFVSVYIHVSA